MRSHSSYNKYYSLKCRRTNTTTGLLYDKIVLVVVAIVVSMVLLSSSHSGGAVGVVNAADTFLFVTPGEEYVICSDEITNVCTAPIICGSLGKTNFSTGMNLNFATTQQTNDLYTITGGYTIQFPSTCNITCTGNCTCEKCNIIEKVASSASSNSDSAASSSNSSTVFLLLAVVTTTMAMMFGVWY